ncbi:unnamed protein product, partial [Mesorhabditis spiculigera]
MFEIFDYATAFDRDKCEHGPTKYTIVYLAFIIIRHSVIIITPSFLFWMSSALRKPLCRVFRRLSSRTEDVVDSYSVHNGEFRNVMGQKVSLRADQDAYFGQLANLW